MRGDHVHLRPASGDCRDCHARTGAGLSELSYSGTMSTSLKHRLHKQRQVNQKSTRAVHTLHLKKWLHLNNSLKKAQAIALT